MNTLPFQYQIRRSERATKARIVVTLDKIEVVAPAGISEHRLHDFVLSQQQWIINAIAKIENQSLRQHGYAPISCHHGAEIPFFGASYPLMIRPSKLKKVKIDFIDEFIAHVPETILRGACSEMIKIALINWMKKQLKQQVELIVQRHGPTSRLYPRSISIKTQKSRWGSCGSRNDININWLLILAPAAVLEYVVVHELCHIQIKNHSSQFWALVAVHLPDYQKQRRWLKQNGSALMRGI